MMLRSRIAPTPSGYLHVGNALSFVLTWLWVRKQNGLLRLRIDDLDTTRARPEYIQDIFYTLDWLGLTWDEGPTSPDDHEKHHAQYLHHHRYAAFTNELISTGKVFACTASRSSLAGGTTGTSLGLNIPLNTPHTNLRIITPDPCNITVTDVQAGNITINLYETMQHFVIRRRDGIAAYQLASLADDIKFNTNLIIRGNDLLNSTAAQLYLAQLTGDRGFAQCRFYHHPLITDVQGIKLSKSAGSPSLKAWREAKRQPEEFYIMLSNLLGWRHPATSLKQMLQQAHEGATLIMKEGNTMV